jgi:hypothetical protein
MDNKVKEFESKGGIFQPIRAITTPTKNKTIFDVINTCTEIAVTHDAVSRGCAKAKDDWKKLVNKSNIIGYFAAIKEGNSVVVSYSICKPEDWKTFNKNISKKIAASKINNKCWTVTKDHIFENTKTVPTHSMKHRRWAAHKCGIAFHMLGTFEQQFQYFIRRVNKYFKTND